MYGPKPKGFWSGDETPGAELNYDFLKVGRLYRVAREFTDFEGCVHAVGETWTFFGYNFLPYEDGMSFFVSLDGSQEWHIRLQWRPEEQGLVLDRLEEYIAPLKGSGGGPYDNGEVIGMHPEGISNEARLVHLVRTDSHIMMLLRAVRALGLNQWCIAAGVIRNRVWDHLHNFTEPTRPSDIDVLFYDALRTEPGYEDEIERRLSELVPTGQWEAVNQATIHSYTGDEPYHSIEEAMSRWADLVTAVGVHLNDADEIEVIAPAGLDDLFDLKVRPNLVAPNAAAVYQKRMATKGWLERWPQLDIEHP